MDNTIDRNSIAMRKFAGDLQQYCDDINYLVFDLSSVCIDAASVMQDDSGRKALNVLTQLAEDLQSQVNAARILLENINVSASLLEQSEEVL